LEEDDAPLDNAPLEEATLDDTEHKDSDDENSDSLHSSAASEVAKEESLQLDNPDLDLAALLNDGSNDASSDDLTPPEDFLDVEALMDDGDDTIDPDSQELDLDVSLSEFTGVTDEDTVIDIDKDAGQNANLDLARAYIEMDDVDAAKELLEEVMVEGSDEQKEEAESILKSIR
jgi:pilus assembly protein FimV